MRTQNTSCESQEVQTLQACACLQTVKKWLQTNQKLSYSDADNLQLGEVESAIIAELHKSLEERQFD